MKLAEVLEKVFGIPEREGPSSDGLHHEPHNQQHLTKIALSRIERDLHRMDAIVAEAETQLRSRGWLAGEDEHHGA